MHVLDATPPGGGEDANLETGPSGAERGVWTGQNPDEVTVRGLLSRLKAVEGLAGIRYDSDRVRFLIEIEDFREDGTGPSLAGIARLVEEYGGEMGRILRVSMINRTIE